MTPPKSFLILVGKGRSLKFSPPPPPLHIVVVDNPLAGIRWTEPEKAILNATLDMVAIFSEHNKMRVILCQA